MFAVLFFFATADNTLADNNETMHANAVFKPIAATSSLKPIAWPERDRNMVGARIRGRVGQESITSKRDTGSARASCITWCGTPHNIETT